MVKKLLVSTIVFCVLVGGVFAYTPTKSDQMIVSLISQKIEEIKEEKPEMINILQSIFKKTKKQKQVEGNEKMVYIIDEILHKIESTGHSSFGDNLPMQETTKAPSNQGDERVACNLIAEIDPPHKNLMKISVSENGKYRVYAEEEEYDHSKINIYQNGENVFSVKGDNLQNLAVSNDGEDIFYTLQNINYEQVFYHNEKIKPLEYDKIHHIFLKNNILFFIAEREKRYYLIADYKPIAIMKNLPYVPIGKTFEDVFEIYFKNNSILLTDRDNWIGIGDVEKDFHIPNFFIVGVGDFGEKYIKKDVGLGGKLYGGGIAVVDGNVFYDLGTGSIKMYKEGESTDGEAKRRKIMLNGNVVFEGLVATLDHNNFGPEFYLSQGFNVPLKSDSTNFNKKYYGVAFTGKWGEVIDEPLYFPSIGHYFNEDSILIGSHVGNSDGYYLNSTPLSKSNNYKNFEKGYEVVTDVVFSNNNKNMSYFAKTTDEETLYVENREILNSGFNYCATSSLRSFQLFPVGDGNFVYIACDEESHGDGISLFWKNKNILSLDHAVSLKRKFTSTDDSFSMFFVVSNGKGGVESKESIKYIKCKAN